MIRTGDKVKFIETTPEPFNNQVGEVINIVGEYFHVKFDNSIEHDNWNSRKWRDKKKCFTLIRRNTIRDSKLKFYFT